MKTLLLTTGFLLVGSAASFAQSAYPIAGTAPNQRPAGAPTLTQFVQDKAWVESFFAGVARPLPKTLKWSSDQGAWYTPFNRPNATGPYDIRNLHSD